MTNKFYTESAVTRGENNMRIADYGYSLTVSFRIAKRTFFTIYYGHVKVNPLPYFSTTAERLTFSGRDYTQCGQAQDELLIGSARSVWEKWERKHLHYLTTDELLELLADIENLKDQYPWIENDHIENQYALDREITLKKRSSKVGK